MNPSQLQKYQQTSVQTATGPQLVIMLYDGAIRFTKMAIDGIEQMDVEKAHKGLLKAQAVINELIASLNFDYVLSKDLSRIYEFMLYQLIQANLKKNSTSAKIVLDHLLDLKEAWVQAAKIVSSDKTGVLNHG
ncbi:flagellar export chaperone FliS [Paenibacillus sp. CGMCC 1.16610]|uniref:Flagellar secretion chaperone FliS n=1 Tax=Paenibacillus anseongense TaxID=2682845 RepID=A0ABW9U4Z6_9BACL|nr:MULTISPECIES: flagellar export chaperone FliS [Paenibacillus]MBA2942402.1 flagellar export chaperone FliS [Paenibacillus sp. CGMCC 1.16610]MVQ34477.1 flagellar export chaperone FliS [Paenibacillus anseongense]